MNCIGLIGTDLITHNFHNNPFAINLPKKCIHRTYSKRCGKETYFKIDNIISRSHNDDNKF